MLQRTVEILGKEDLKLKYEKCYKCYTINSIYKGILILFFNFTYPNLIIVSLKICGTGRSF